MWSNYLSVPTDCPQRAERVGWTADTQVFASTASYYSTNTKPFLEKWLNDLRDCQLSDGQYLNGCPRGRCGGTKGAFAWADAGILVPYYLYRMFGDKKTIADCYDSMQRYIDGFLAKTNGKGAEPKYGDWLSPLGNSLGTRQVLAMAYYAWVAKYMSEMANVLDKHEDAERYKQLYEAEKKLFNDTFIDMNGNVENVTQTVLLTMLHMDLIDDKSQLEKYLDIITETEKKDNYKVQTGFLGTAIVLPVLSRFGRTDTAYRMLLCEECPSWLFSVTQGATTVWEHWDAYTEEKGYVVPHISLNHYAFGAAMEWMYSCAAGIKPECGFKRFVIAPEPNRALSHLCATYESPYGTIVSKWEYVNDGLIFDIAVPANTSATIRIPCHTGDVLMINDVPFDKTESIDEIRFEGGSAQFLAESGRYLIYVKFINN